MSDESLSQLVEVEGRDGRRNSNRGELAQSSFSVSHQSGNPPMAEQEEENSNAIDELHKLEIPTRRVKNIMELDKDIKKVNSEALFLIASSTELFLQFLAEISAYVVLAKKKRTVRVEHLPVAVKRHRPTADFLLDSLPMPPQPSEQNPPKDWVKSRPDKKLVPFATRSIDAFLRKFT
ncbi:hypothetical protein DH2020_029852 [Rehmannia glutinosa]|uniref:Transcription factor CBF/NF-Y/archaeal histone domain-containing protein n=1 Tax=Rehmannia glutinosa TaxID=99300 RepID=A0ABR0VMF9_REHGL